MTTLFDAIAPRTAFAPTIMSFIVFGTPVPQGSTKAYIPKGWKRAIITADNTKTKPWRQQVSGVASALNVTPFAKHVPVAMILKFYFTKPLSAPKLRTRPSVQPDLDKLVRAIFDSLKGIAINDDAQVVDLNTQKYYGSPARVEIQISEVRA